MCSNPILSPAQDYGSVRLVNSTPNDHTGAGYGILQHDDRHFQRNQVKVVLDNGEVAEVSLSKTFWTTSLNSRVSGDGC